MTNAVKIAKINYEYKLVDDKLDNPKDFWWYVRSTQMTKENVADLRNCKLGIYAKTIVTKAQKVQSELNDLSITPEIVKKLLS